MITYERFKYGLTNLDPTQWRLFELLANVFLANEFSNLRPLASASGDGGMDAALFRDDDDPEVVLQFSVRKDWGAKIIETCNRLAVTAPETRLLVYATNQNIGAAATNFRSELKKKTKIKVDVRDREWFLTNRNLSGMVSAEADEFCQKVADASLLGASAIEHHAQALSDLESKAAFIYLGLQWEDDTREKGLTRLCFEAIVRSVLRETTNKNRMTRLEIQEQVSRILPAHNSATLGQYVDSALGKLDKVHIRHWRKPDEFCLMWSERLRLAERVAEMESLAADLGSELERILRLAAAELDVEVAEDSLGPAVARLIKIIENILLDRGEVFASAVTKNHGAFVKYQDIEAVVYHDLLTGTSIAELNPRLAASAIQTLLIEPPESVRKYLRSLADTYTLFAFMRETPDVQSAIVKIFADADIWLDTSVVLPLLAEALLDESLRNHSLLLKAASECGLRLYVTDGVIEELATHVGRSVSFSRASTQYGKVPFLYSSYRLRGGSPQDFPRWAENFCGDRRPADDIADYLHDNHRIRVKNLKEELDQTDQVLRAAVSEVWREAREAREQKKLKIGMDPMDPLTQAKLVLHDVENYLGVAQRRVNRNERRSAFGFKSWWLTMDGTAFRMSQELRDRINDAPPPSPAISMDFMLNYLAVGPVRSKLSRKTEETLPLMMNMSVLDAVPTDLLELADVLRTELADLPPRVVNRKIRDTLDDARMLLGPVAKRGDIGLTDDVKRRLLQQARER